MGNLRRLLAGVLLMALGFSALPAGPAGAGQEALEPTDLALIAGGGLHSAGIAQDGTVWTWGSSRYGQLGPGAEGDQAWPEPVPGLRDVVAVTAGAGHTAALTAAGQVWTWGLTQGASGFAAAPTRVPGLEGVTTVAAGAYHTIALREDGSLWAWGWNGHGQIGDGSTQPRTRPVRVKGIPAVSGDPAVDVPPAAAAGEAGPLPPPVVAVAAGYAHTLAVTGDGRVWAWGSNQMGQLGMGRTGGQMLRPQLVPELGDVVAVAAGFGHSLALKADGTVWAWGQNRHGQLGTGSREDQPAPVAVAGLPPVVAVAAGQEFSLALGADGTVWAWGRNDRGQLGDGSQVDQPAPVPVAGVGEAVAIAAGFWHGLALQKDGSLRVWGFNAAGQLGDGTRVTRLRTVLGRFSSQPDREPPALQAAAPGLGRQDVLPGAAVTLVFSEPLAPGPAWSGIALRQLPKPEPPGVAPPGEEVPVQVVVSGDRLAVAPLKPLAPERRYRLEVPAGALVDRRGNPLDAPVSLDLATGRAAGRASGDGGVVAESEATEMGTNDAGTNTTATDKAQMMRLRAVAAGAAHSLALRADGTVWAWGAGAFGQVGDGTTWDRPLPVPVPGLTEVEAVAAGAYHSVALRADGTVWTWGCSPFGQPEDDPGRHRPAPVQVPGLSQVVAVAAGADHTLALRRDGTVWAWGGNDRGQLGDGTRASRSRPVPVAGLTDVKALAAGSGFSAALRTDGSLWVWGQANRPDFLPAVPGPVGTIPRPVPGLDGVAAIAAGDQHLLALRSDGTVWAWGRNVAGQLGSGDFFDQEAPVPVPGLDQVVAVAAGPAYSLALRRDGTLWAWGAVPGEGTGAMGMAAVPGSAGAMGPAVRRPHLFFGLSGLTALAAGGAHGLVLTADGTVWGWGANDRGQAGQGSFSAWAAPGQVLPTYAAPVPLPVRPEGAE